MVRTPFRFLHSSDWHLEQPAGGVTDFPDSLRSVLLDAPFRAAQRVIDLAIQERVDFLLLSGGIVRLSAAGPRGLIFLLEQFERLAEHGIEVYWAGGTTDLPEEWPHAVPLPSNVFRFPTERMQTFLHQRDGHPICAIVGASEMSSRPLVAADYPHERSDLPTLAVAYGQATAEDLARAGFCYWALGASDERTVLAGQLNAIYCGSPQARSPQASGSQSCTLVTVDDEQQVRASVLPTDVLRYVNERIVLSQTSNLATLEKLLTDRVRTLYPGELGPDLIVTWKIAAPVALRETIQRGLRGQEMLRRLQNEMSARRPHVYSLAIELETENEFSEETFAQDSLLGEFLRTVRDYQQDTQRTLDISPFLPAHYRHSSLASELMALSHPDRETLLREVGQLGNRLFSGEEHLA